MSYTKDKWISFILAMLICFLGIGVEMTTNNSSLCTKNTADTSALSVYLEEDKLTEPLLGEFFITNHNVNAKNFVSASNVRWQNRTYLLVLIVGSFLQYLFCYQSAECKEDGQLFLCRSAIVDYIHLKDSGE